MRLLSCLFILSTLLLPSTTRAQEYNTVEKTVCMAATGFPDLAALKDALLVEAKREAVSEFFGELISASTAVENAVVTSDQIQASSLGFVRIEGDPDFYNGSNLAEVCITLNAYVTEEDRSQFDPEPITKRLCLADAKLSADALAAQVKTEVIIQALYDYEPTLGAADRRLLPTLVERVTFSEGGFLQDTTTYCATMHGYIVPVELLALTVAPTAANAGTRSSASAAAPAGAPQSGASLAAATDQDAGECATSLAYGQQTDCTLDEENDERRHTFDAKPDDRIIITLIRTSGDIDVHFEVLNKGGDMLALEPGHWDGCAAEGSAEFGERVCLIERTGTYTIKVTSLAEETSGSYRLFLQNLSAPELATPIAFGEPIEGALGPMGDYTYYTFDAAVDDRVHFMLERTDGDIEPYFGVYTDEGNLLALEPGHWDVCAKGDVEMASVDCLFERSRTYSIAVANQADDTEGAYRLRIQRLNDPTPAEELVPGEAVEGELTSDGDRRYYTFELSAGDSFTLALEDTSGDLVSRAFVLDKNGDSLALEPGHWDLCAVEVGSERTCTVDRSGRFTVVVDNYARGTTGGFSLKLETE